MRRRSRLAKLKAGLLLPWTRPPYGYRVGPERPRDPAGVRVDAAEAAAVREMFTWYAEEASSMYRLATKLQDHGVPAPRGHWRWNVATLRGILANPSYAGQVWAGRERRRGPSAGGMSAARPAWSPRSRRGVPRADWVAAAVIPAIVPPALFERVQAKLARNQQFASRHNTVHPYLLRTLVRCGRCGLACRGVWSWRRGRLRTRGCRSPGARPGRVGSCRSRRSRGVGRGPGVGALGRGLAPSRRAGVVRGCLWRTV